MEPTKYDLVLGAGGQKTYAHCGVIDAIQELGIETGVVSGTSGGAFVATLATNGLTPKQMVQAFDHAHSRLFDPSFWAGAVRMPTPQQWLACQSFLSLGGLWRDTVKELGLKPNDRLQIIAYDVVGCEPVVFEGTAIDLATAMEASTAVPGMGGFLPVHYGERLLVDGAQYHFNSTEFVTNPAIVVRLGRATRWPHRAMLPANVYYHWREMYLPMVASSVYVDESKHIVIDIPCDDLAGLSVGGDEDRCRELVGIAKKIARAKLLREIENGRIVRS